ncbi:hypothetical protein D3C78_1425460 [compost metagenome]
MDRHLPRHRPPAAAGPPSGCGLAPGFPDPRLRRPVPSHSPGAQGAQPRREALGPARRDGLHQRQERRRLAPRRHRSLRRPRHPHLSADLQDLSGDLRSLRSGGFCRAVAARPRTVAEPAPHPRALPGSLPEHTGGRVPGHQRHPVRLAADAGRGVRQGDDRRRR